MKGETYSVFPFGGATARVPAHNWGWFALRGALAAVVGIIALVLPGPALLSFATVFAAFSFANGVFSLVSGIRGARRKEERWWTLILSGALGVAVGVIFFFFPLLGTLAYTFTAGLLIAAWAIATGMLEIAAAYRLRRQIRNEWLLMLSGALSVLFGGLLVLMLFSAPALSLLSVATVLGVYALLAGMSLLALAFRLRKRAA